MWEYKWQYLEMKKAVLATEVNDGEKMLLRLNELGRDGWEIVGVVPLAVGSGVTTRIMVWLKRVLRA